jgi:hypothetical protein
VVEAHTVEFDEGNSGHERDDANSDDEGNDANAGIQGNMMLMLAFKIMMLLFMIRPIALFILMYLIQDSGIVLILND